MMRGIKDSPVDIKPDDISIRKRSKRVFYEKIGTKGFLTVLHRKFVASQDGKEFNKVTGERGFYEEIYACKNKENLQTLAGRDDLITKGYTANGTGTAASNYICVSADATAPSTADTVVAGEITTNGLARAQATTRTHTVGTNAWSLQITFTDTTAATTGIVKYGLLTAVTGGVLNHENTATSVTLQIGDELVVTWTGTVG